MADTANYHQYGVIISQSTNDITGVQVSRTNPVVRQFDGDCPSPNYAPVFAATWLNVPDGWLEVGTAFACSGKRYYYWGQADLQGWHQAGTAPVPSDFSPHTFSIVLASTGIWQIAIDGHAVGSLRRGSRANGTHVAAGGESYQPRALMPPMRLDRLLVRRGGAWHAWPGAGPYSDRDFHVVKVSAAYTISEFPSWKGLVASLHPTT